MAGAVYATIAVNVNTATANAELDHYMEEYSMQPTQVIRQQQYCFAGDRAAVTAWLNEFVEAGATHICARFTGNEDQRQMETLAEMREDLSS